MARRPEWLFDGSPIDDPLGHGERAVQFLRGLTHAGTGKRFQLDEWQERFVRMTYGPRWHDGTRKYTRVYAMIPRGARKTGLGAGLAMYHTIGWEKVPFGQVHLAACNRKQSKIAYRECQGFIMADPRLRKYTKVLSSQNKITHRKSEATLEAISADAATANGLTSKFVLFDEVHAWRDRRLYDTLITGLGKTGETLGVVISQAGVGTGVDNLAYDIFSAARRIADDPDIEPRTLPVVFETLPGDDWRDERIWHIVNPGLTCSPPYPNIEALRQEARESETRPACRIRFLNDRLNLWQDSRLAPFIDAETWGACRGTVDLERLATDRVPCWLGVDLSMGGDLTAIVAVWPDPDREGRFLTHPWFFAPAERLEEREGATKKPYVSWVRDGLLLTTPGYSLDLNVVEAKIRELCETFNVECVAYDPALSQGIAPRLANADVPMVEQRQGGISMMPCIDTADRVINGRLLAHPDHPILNWNVENIDIEYNALGHKVRLRKPDHNHNLCIDGALALVMALHHAASGNSARSIYEDGGPREDGPIVVHEWDVDFAA